METLKNRLKIDSLSLKDAVLKEELRDLAKLIMKNYCIYNGSYHYRPIEIEFYIYDKNQHPDRHVYPRDNMYIGELFFHYSGMDICFERSFENGRFGGILIRALERDEDKQLFGGPLVCVNEVLNSAIIKCVIKKICEQNIEVKEFGRRVGINKLKSKSFEDNFYDKKYRFVREDIKEKAIIAQNSDKSPKSIFQRNSYNFSKNIFEPKSSSYKIEEYIPKKEED